MEAIEASYSYHDADSPTHYSVSKEDYGFLTVFIPIGSFTLNMHPDPVVFLHKIRWLFLVIHTKS